MIDDDDDDDDATMCNERLGPTSGSDDGSGIWTECYCACRTIAPLAALQIRVNKKSGVRIGTCACRSS